MQKRIITVHAHRQGSRASHAEETLCRRVLLACVRVWVSVQVLVRSLFVMGQLVSAVDSHFCCWHLLIMSCIAVTRS